MYSGEVEPSTRSPGPQGLIHFPYFIIFYVFVLDGEINLETLYIFNFAIYHCNESPLKMMKNALYFILKDLFVLKTFLS